MWYLALQLVVHADDGAVRDVRVRKENLLEAAGGQAVTTDIDNVVGPRHHEHIT